MSKRFLSLLPDLLILGVLVFAGWKLLHGLEQVQDILLYDESGYLDSGVRLLSRGLPHAESAPLFAIWYYLLSFARHDPLGLFYLSFKLLTVLLPISLYAVLRRYKCPPIPSACIAFLLLISSANLPTGPKVSQFAVLVILASLFVASFARSNTVRLSIMTAGALLASYARPELFFAFVILFLLTAGLLVLRERRISNLVSVGVLGAGALLLIVPLGVPPAGTWRSSMAFAQHFSLNWVSWTHNTTLSPWDDWQQIVAQNFGAAQTIPDVARSNPPLFIKHLAYNALAIPTTLVGLFFRHGSILLPADYQNLEAILLFSAMVLVVLVKYRDNLRELPTRLRSQPSLILALLGYLVVSLTSVILVYPEDHYLLITGIILIVLLTPLVTGTSLPQKPRLDQLLAVSVLIALLTPLPSSLLGNFGTPNAETIKTIRQLGIRSPVMMLDDHGDFGTYLGSNFKSIGGNQNTSDFYSLLSEKNVNMILADPALERDVHLKNDVEFAAFLKNYSAYGYTAIDIPHTERRLLLKTGLSSLQ